MALRWRVKLNFPFDWELKLKFDVLPERPTPAQVRNGKWFRAFRLEGRLIPVMVRGLGTPEKPVLEFTTPKLGRRLKNQVAKAVFRLHGVEDPSDLHRFMERNPVLKRVLARLRGFGRAGLMAADPYEGIVKSIVQQQIALKVAENIIANIVERFGEHVNFGGETVYGFPEPERLAEASLEELKSCGLSLRKAEYIKDFSVRVAEGDFNPQSLYRLTPKEIIEVLTGFRGMGRWTAELVMAATLGLNVIPADDLGVRRAVSHFFFKRKMQSAEAVRKFAEENFGPYQREIIVYLLMAYRLGLQ